MCCCWSLYFFFWLLACLLVESRFNSTQCNAMLVHMCTLFMETRLCVWTSKWANSWNTHRPLRAALVNVHVQSNEVRGVQILATILPSLATLDHVLDRFQVLYPNKLTLVTLYLAPAEQHPAEMYINNNKNEKKRKKWKKKQKLCKTNT